MPWHYKGMENTSAAATDYFETIYWADGTVTYRNESGEIVTERS